MKKIWCLLNFFIFFPQRFTKGRMEKEVARKKFRQVLQDEISKASGMKFSVDLKDKPKATPRVIHALGIKNFHVTHSALQKWKIVVQLYY